MTTRAIEILSEIERVVKDYDAQFVFPRVSPGRFAPPRQLVENLVAELATISELTSLENQQFSTWNQSGEIHLSSLAAAMTERIVDGAAATSVFSDLMDLVIRRKTDICVAMGIAGISVKETIHLADGVAVMPPANLPPTNVREDMFDLDRSGRRLFRGSMVRENLPEAALLLRGELTVIHDKDVPPAERQALADDFAAKRDRALTCLTLSGPECAPFVASSSSWIDHPAYPYSGFGLSGYGRYSGVYPSKRGLVDPELACRLFRQMQDANAIDWPAIFRATERLSRSRSHAGEVDRAIDLGISIDMIFLHDLQDDRSELSYRIALRGAWLVGKAGTPRRQVFQSLRAAYTARSRAVHSGTLTDPKLIENLPVADEFCAEGIRLIISQGGFPKQWDLLVLGEIPDS